MKTDNSCEFVDLLYIVVYILDEIKFSFTEFSFTDYLGNSKRIYCYITVQSVQSVLYLKDNYYIIYQVLGHVLSRRM